MFRIEVLQNEWLMLAMVAGLGLLLAFVLAYVAFWRPRGEILDEGSINAQQGRRASLGYLPWLLIVTYVGTAVFAIVYTWVAIKYPRNW